MEVLLTLCLFFAAFALIGWMADYLMNRFSREIGEAKEESANFSCPNPRARAAVMDLLRGYGVEIEIPSGHKERSATKVDLSQNDSQTVNCLDKRLAKKLSYAKQAIGFAVDDPLSQARQSAHFLRMKGFGTTVEEMKTDDALSVTFTLVISEAFDGWVLVFRDKNTAVSK